MLKQRALHATLWSGIDVFSRQGVQFLVALILARFLSAEEFGTFGLLFLFTGIASIFVDGGFSAALIQRQDIDQTDESTVFWFNLFMGAIVTILLYSIAPGIAAFYGQPILQPLLTLMALNVFLGAIGAIHGSLLTKRLDFVTQMKVGVISVFVSGSVAVLMAWNGYGVWALATQAIVMTGASTTLLWLLNRWRPTLEFSRNSVSKLLGFGGYHFASILMDVIYSRLYTVLIGKFYSVRDLGYYTNADTTQQMPSGVLVKILSRVAFPMLSSASDDKVKMRRGMQLAIRGAMLVNVPMMLGMFAVSDPLVRVLFGIKWLPAVPLLRVLCLAGLLLPLHALNLNCLMAQGHSRLMFRLESFKKMIGLVLLGAGAYFGVMGVAWAMVAFSGVGLILNAHYTKRFLDYGVFAQTRDFLPILISGILMAAIIFPIATMWQSPPAIKLIGLVAIGIVVFLGIVLTARLKAASDVLSLFYRSPSIVTRNEDQP